MIKPLGNADVVEFVPDAEGCRESDGEYFVVRVTDGQALLLPPNAGCGLGFLAPVEKLRRVRETFGEFTREPFVDEESVMGGDSGYEYYD